MTPPHALDEPPGSPFGPSLLAWLQLIRLPTLFTALADVLLGALLVDAEWPTATTGLLLLTSTGMYLSGMVFNDIFDRGRDAIQRPSRPLPSGRISLAAAVGLAVLLMVGGLASAAASGTTGLVVAVTLAACVLAYDGGLKTTGLGPIVMGACRSLNVLLGAAAAGSFSALAASPLIHVATGLGIYIAGVTWFARNETDTSRPGQLRGAMLVINIGLATLILFAANRTIGDNRTSVLLLLALIVASINRRLLAALRDPQPGKVQAGIRLLLLSLVMLDATLALATTGQADPALLIASLLIPALVLKRWIPMT